MSKIRNSMYLRKVYLVYTSMLILLKVAKSQKVFPILYHHKNENECIVCQIFLFLLFKLVENICFILHAVTCVN